MKSSLFLRISLSCIFLAHVHSYSQGRHNQERFSSAYDLISQGQYEKALQLLKENIKETPNATNLDYDYGWATICLARLCRVEELVQFYKTMRTRFDGLLQEGGALRDWDDKLLEAKQVIASCAHSNTRAVVEELNELDRKSKLERDSTLERLILLGSMGNPRALQRLELNGAALAKFVAQGRLVVAKQSDSPDSSFFHVSGNDAVIRKRGYRAMLYLPPLMRSALVNFDPDFAVWNLSDYDSLLRRWYPYSDKNLPFVALGDFNGDGIQDAVLHGRNKSAAMMICILSTDSAFRVLTVQKWEVSPGWTLSDNLEVYLTQVGRGLIKSGFEPQPLNLTTDAFEIGFFEKAATLYYYKDGRFLQYTTSD